MDEQDCTPTAVPEEAPEMIISENTIAEIELKYDEKIVDDLFKVQPIREKEKERYHERAGSSGTSYFKVIASPEEGVGIF